MDDLQRDIERIDAYMRLRGSVTLPLSEYDAAWQRIRARLTPDRERVARAMFAFAANWDAMPNDDGDYWLALADAAIDAMGETP